MPAARRGLPIRDAVEADLPAIRAILNEAIATTTARWSDEAETTEAVAAWFAAATARRHPVLVAHDDGDVLGYGSFAPFRVLPGYRFTVEHTLYVRPAAQRRGIGGALLRALTDRARAAGLHTMVGLIAADNDASLALHRAAGFAVVGRMEAVGYKFGRWLDLVLVQRMP